jgi:uncharacterized membrane protein
MPLASPRSAHLALYLPAYVFTVGTDLFVRASLTDLAVQAFVQGLLTAIVSSVLYGRAVSILGASSGSAFAALCPAMTALLAIPVLGEWPALADRIAITVISAGVYVISGGPLHRLALNAHPTKCGCVQCVAAREHRLIADFQDGEDGTDGSPNESAAHTREVAKECS